MATRVVARHYDRALAPTGLTTNAYSLLSRLEHEGAQTVGSLAAGLAMDRTTLSRAISIGLLLFGLMAPFSAALMDRFGVRRVMLIALTTIATGASLTTIMTTPWQLDLLWGVLVGGATGAVGVPLAAVVANRWFSTRRGLVTGILTASNASGQMVFLPALAWLPTAYGWRWAAVPLAVRALVVV